VRVQHLIRKCEEEIIWITICVWEDNIEMGLRLKKGYVEMGSEMSQNGVKYNAVCSVRFLPPAITNSSSLQPVTIASNLPPIRLFIVRY
jgi:hypothetical protein